MVALDPSPHLAFEITLRLTQITQADFVVLDGVQAHEVVEERLAEMPCHGSRQKQARGQLPAQNSASNRLHKVERSVENTKIVAIQNHFGRNVISFVQLG